MLRPYKVKNSYIDKKTGIHDKQYSEETHNLYRYYITNEGLRYNLSLLIDSFTKPELLFQRLKGYIDFISEDGSPFVRTIRTGG